MKLALANEVQLIQKCPPLLNYLTFTQIYRTTELPYNWMQFVMKGVGYSSPLLTLQGLSFDLNNEPQIHRDESSYLFIVSMLGSEWNIYRLTHSASELSGFTCTSSLTMNEKFQYRTRSPSAVLKNFEFIVSEIVQVNPDNSRAMSALTFLLFKLNTLQAKLVKF